MRLDFNDYRPGGAGITRLKDEYLRGQLAIRTVECCNTVLNALKADYVWTYNPSDPDAAWLDYLKETVEWHEKQKEKENV